MPSIQLFGGECDGTVVKVASAARPEIYYAVSSAGEQQIRETHGNKAKTELRSKLATIAYKFDKCVTKVGVGLEYRYTRCPELDHRPDDNPPVDQA